MKKLMLILCILSLIPYISLSQAIENVDQLQGYKEFKFGIKVLKVDTCFKKSQPVLGFEPEEDYYTFNKNYNKFLNHNSTMFQLFVDKDILYKIEFWFKDELFKERTDIGMETKVDLLWRDIVKLFGEPNRPVEIETSFLGNTKTYTWEGNKNIIEYQVYKEGESLSLFIYDKKLNNAYKLSQFK